MLRTFLTGGLVICVMGWLAVTHGCSDSGDKAPREFISIGTAPPGGAFYDVGAAITAVLNDHRDTLGWTVNAQPNDGSIANMKQLAQGRIEFALSNASITYFAVRGQATSMGTAEPKQEVMNVMSLYTNFGQFITVEGSGVRTLADLKGKRVSVGPAAAGMENFLRPILEAHGVAYTDFEAVHMGQQDSVSALGDGTIQAAFLGGRVPLPALAGAMTTLDIRLLPYDPDARRRLVETYPFYFERTLEAGTYQRLTEPFHGLDVGVTHVITAADADEDMVYGFVKTLYEHREDAAARFPGLRAITAQNVIRDVGVPFHPGAIRYYREIGIWIED
jgi:TRAP transporter TAXI family solute receptor